MTPYGNHRPPGLLSLLRGVPRSIVTAFRAAAEHEKAVAVLRSVAGDRPFSDPWKSRHVRAASRDLVNSIVYMHAIAGEAFDERAVVAALKALTVGVRRAGIGPVDGDAA